MDAFYPFIIQGTAQGINITLRSFPSPRTVNTNSIEVNVQPEPNNQFMPFIITPTITGSGNNVQINFSMGGNQGETPGTLHQVTVEAADDQGNMGVFQFYYYINPTS